MEGIALAASGFPFGAIDIVLLALGVALLLTAGVLARRVLDIVARQPRSAVAERHASRVNRLRAISETASGRQPGKQA